MTGWVLMVLAANAVDGGLSSSDVEDVLQLEAARFADCPQTQLQFEVNEAGVVKASGDACANKALESIQFPSATAATSVRWTLVKQQTPKMSAVSLPPDAFDADVSRCYDEVQATSFREGSARAMLTVLRSGAVFSSGVSTSKEFDGTSLASCLTTAARAWRLPADDEMRFVSLGWTFTSSALRAPPGDGHVVVSKVIKNDAMEVMLNEVREVSRGAPVRSCVRGLKERGHITLKVVIVATGEVTKVETVKNTLSDEVRSCVENAMGALRFKPLVGGKGLSMTFPFTFVPEAGEAK